MNSHFLTALPVFNEAAYVSAVLDEVRRYSSDVLVVDDGSTDDTPRLVEARNDIQLLSHSKNQGYGAALASAFEFAAQKGYEILVTIDCDGQHQPRQIPAFVEACRNADIVSGSRYLKSFPGDSTPPRDRQRINALITDKVNHLLGLSLTDAFCGFKAYRVNAIRSLKISEAGYAMPLEVWAQAAHLGLKIVELPVRLIYLDESRSFGGSLDNSGTRLRHYEDVLKRALDRIQAANGEIPDQAVCGASCQ